MPTANLDVAAAGEAAGGGDAMMAAGPGWHDRVQELEFLLGHLPGFAYRSRRADPWFLEYISDGVLAVTGYTVADLIETRGQSTATIMDPADQTWFWPAVQAALAGGQPYAFEYRIRTASGATRWLLDKGQGIYADGKLVGATGFATDITDHKQTEEALRTSRDNLNAVFEGLYDAIFVADVATGRILDVNSAATRLMNLPKERLIGLPQTALHPPEVKEHVLQVFREHVEGGSPDEDIEVFTGDGRRVTVRISSLPMLFKDGRRVVVGCFHDMTASRAAEQALRDSERRYRRLFELESDAIVVIDNESCQILDANQAAERLYGYSRAELRALRSIDLSAEPEATRQVSRSLMPHVPLRYHRRRDGTVFPVEITGSYFEEGGRMIHIAAIRDITARVAGERTLQELARERDSLLNNLPGFAFRCRNDDACTMEYVSDGVEALTGYPAADFRDNRERAFLSIMNAADIAAVAAETTKAFQARQPYVVEYRIRTAAGEERWLWEKGRGIYDGETLVASEGFATDVTERHRAEAMQQTLQAQLVQAQKMEGVGRLAGGVAHDFNNILTVILGCSAMAMDETREPQTLADLRHIHRAGERARNLTRQLLAVGRKQILDLRRTDLNHVILDYVDMLKRLIGEDISVQTVLQPGLWEISGDAAQIVQILMTLATNARDSMPTGGRLTLRTTNQEALPAPAAALLGLRCRPHVLLEVTDTGCGMDAETQKHLFEPFFTTKPVGEGTGLGLATIHGIVEQHGGRIVCESRPGQGSSFRVYLPRLASANAEPTEATTAPPPTGGAETILLVEDDPAVLRMAATFLARYGYQVVSAASPAEALRLAATMQPLDLLLSDVIMPEMSGRELYAKVAELKPGVRVLYMSGYPGGVLSERGYPGAGIRLVQKPFTCAALATQVRETLAAPG